MTATGVENRGIRNRRHVQRRVVDPPLVQHERGQDRETAHDGHPDDRPAEAVLAAVDDAVRQRDQADHRQQDADEVDPARAAGRATPAPGSRPATTPTITIGTLIRKTEPHQKCSSSAPPTIGPIATARPTAPAQTPIAWPRSRGSKTLEMIDSVDRHDGGAADAHERAGRDELAGALRVRREQRREAEEREPDEQEPLAAEPVAQDAEGEQQAGEDQGVRVDRPLELALRRAEPVHRVGERAQRDVEDGVVEHDDEQAHDQHAENGPAARVAGVDGLLHLPSPPDVDDNTKRMWFVTRLTYARPKRYGTVPYQIVSALT